MRTRPASAGKAPAGAVGLHPHEAEHEEAASRCAGAQFDPELAEVFVELEFDHFDDLLASCEVAARAA